MTTKRMSIVFFVFVSWATATCGAEEPIHIGSRLEPLVDDYLIDTMMNTSTDFLHWSDPVFLEYTGAPTEQLYTNQITPYFRAPQILMGFPKRYTERRKAVDLDKFEWEAVSDGVLMTSRDGVHFHRWGEAFLRPGLQPERWVNRNNYISNGLVVTKSDVPGAPDELSIYSTEGYWSPTCRLRRHTLRIDGFVSVQAPLAGGEFLTKPIVFEGKKLMMNYSTSAADRTQLDRLKALKLLEQPKWIIKTKYANGMMMYNIADPHDSLFMVRPDKRRLVTLNYDAPLATEYWDPDGTAAFRDMFQRLEIEGMVLEGP